MTHVVQYWLMRLAAVFLVSLAFLLPLTASPWTVEALEPNKFFLLVIFGSLIGFLWLIEGAVNKRLSLKFQTVFIFPVLFLIATAISSFFSKVPYSSWLGEGGLEYTSFISLFVMTVLLFCGAYFFEGSRIRDLFIKGVIYSGTILGLLVILIFLGLPLGIFSNTVGLPSALSLYLLVTAVLTSGYLSINNFERPHGWLIKLSSGVIFVATTLLLLSVDSRSLWFLTMFGFISLLSFVLARSKNSFTSLSLLPPIVFIVLSGLFFFLPPVIKNRYPLEVGPSFKTSLEMVGHSWRDNSFVVGAGPGSFSSIYAAHTPSSVNGTIFWDTRFDRGSSHLLTILASHGLFGGLVFIAFLLGIVWLLVKFIIGNNERPGGDVIGLSVAWLVLVVSMFLLPQNLTLFGLFILLTASLLALITPPAKKVELTGSVKSAFFGMSLMVIVGLGLVLILGLSFKKYTGEIAFARAVANDKMSSDVDETIRLLNIAIKWNKYNDLYLRHLGGALLIKSGLLLSDPKADQALVQSYVAATVNTGLAATNLAPETVTNWELRGLIYREFSPILEKANDFSLAAFQKAISLAPQNPSYQVELARSYIVRADLLQKLQDGDDKEVANEAKAVQAEVLQLAKSALNKALELKADYVPAKYYLAFVFEREGDLTQAVQAMAEVRRAEPNDLGVGLQLALLYLRQGKLELAEQELNRLLVIAPDFANAHWYLAVLYEEAGEIDKAIAELKFITASNPNNQVVIERIKRLEEGIKPPVTEVPIPEPLAE